MRFLSQDWVLSRALLLLLVSLTTLSSTALGKPKKNIETSVFLSPKFELGPGSVANKFYYNVDFPKGHIAIKSFNAEVVDESGKSVPLHETYLHHWIVVKYHQPKNDTNIDNIVIVSNSGVCQNGHLLTQYFGLGSETRKTATDIPDPFGIEVGNPEKVPYGYEEKWMINVHAIDTRGVGGNRVGCTECRCDLYNVTMNPGYKGGSYCCLDNSQCRLDKGFKGPKRSMYLKYTVKWINWHKFVVPLKVYIFDVTDVLNVTKGMSPKHNCTVEYQVDPCSEKYNGSFCRHVKTASIPVPTGGYVIYGVGHLHANGIGTRLSRQNGRIICTSIPKYGRGSEVGNEKGYIVGMSTCYPKPGSLKIRDGETLTLEVRYENSELHTGVMGLFYLLVTEQLPHKHHRRLLAGTSFMHGSLKN